MFAAKWRWNAHHVNGHTPFTTKGIDDSSRSSVITAFVGHDYQHHVSHGTVPKNILTEFDVLVRGKLHGCEHFFGA